MRQFKRLRKEKKENRLNFGLILMDANSDDKRIPCVDLDGSGFVG